MSFLEERVEALEETVKALHSTIGHKWYRGDAPLIGRPYKECACSAREQIEVMDYQQLPSRYELESLF